MIKEGDELYFYIFSDYFGNIFPLTNRSKLLSLFAQIIHYIIYLLALYRFMKENLRGNKP